MWRYSCERGRGRGRNLQDFEARELGQSLGDCPCEVVGVPVPEAQAGELGDYGRKRALEPRALEVDAPARTHT